LKNKVVVSAPGKLMLFGEHAVVYGYPCIVTAVDRRIQVVAELINEKVLKINAPGVDLKDYDVRLGDLTSKASKPANFIQIAVKNFYNAYKIKRGIRIETRSQFSSEFGFGSSSAVTVATLAALSEVFNLNLSKRNLFDLGYKTVLEIQGVGSGFDIAASIWGGTLYFVTAGKKIEPFHIKEMPLVIGYTGFKADTPTLVRQVASFYKNNKELVELIFNGMNLIVKDARKALKDSEFKKIGDLANINQGLLDSLGVNTTKLSNLIFAARSAGAYGAKLSGAGGGDCMIAFISKDKRKFIEKAIEKVGGKVLHVKVGAEGVRVEK
jgi:mevalonate kinase